MPSRKIFKERILREAAAGAAAATSLVSQILALSSAGAIVASSILPIVDPTGPSAARVTASDFRDYILGIASGVAEIPEPFSYLDFDQDTAQTDVVGRLLWNGLDGTLNLGLKGGNVVLQVGQEEVQMVRNNSGSALANGAVVRITGSTGTRKTVALAQATTESSSATTFGVATEAIANGADGYVTISGYVRGLDTSAFSAGAVLWLSTTAGGFTTTRPTAPNHGVVVGYCVTSHATQGIIYVSIDNGFELDELHNVLITSAADADVLSYVNANGRWENKTLSSLGAVVGPASATDNAVVRFDGTTGKLVQNSAVTIADTGTMAIAAGSTTNALTVTTTGAITASLRYDASSRLDISVSSVGIVTYTTALANINARHEFNKPIIVNAQANHTSSYSAGAILGSINIQGTTSYSQSAGGVFTGTWSNTSTITEMSGVEARGGNNSTGIITHMHGVWVRTMNNVSTGSIGTLYGLRVESQTAGSTNYAIYTNSGLVRFGDAVSTTSSMTALRYVATGAVTAGTYSADLLGASGAARDILRAGVSGVSNGFTVQYDGSAMVYTFIDGNVGIGTTTGASYPLQVRRAGGAGSLGINVDGVGSVQRVAQYYTIGDTTTVTTGHAFYTRNASATDVLAMVIENNGRVGIGTNAPADPLHVFSSGTALLRLETNGAVAASVKLINTTGEATLSAVGNDLELRTSSSTTLVLTAKNTGAVNFNPRATPSSPVAGDVYYDSGTNKIRCYDGSAWNDLF